MIGALAVLVAAPTASPAQTTVICNPAAKFANVRPGPSAKNFPTIADKLTNGTPVKVLDRVMNQEAGREWYKIEFRGTKSGGTETAYVDSISVNSTCAPPPATNASSPAASPAATETAKAPAAPAFADLQVTIDGHDGEVDAARFTPDGTRIVTISKKIMRVWDAATGKLISKMTGHTENFLIVGFSNDNARVATSAFHDRTARIWDLATGEQKLVVYSPGTFMPSAALSRDGRRLVSSSHDGTVQVWDAASGALLRTLSGHSDRVQMVAISPDGKKVATASFDKSAKIWEIESGATLATIKGHGNQVSFVAFTPDSQRLVTESLDDTIGIWDASSGRQLGRIMCRLCWPHLSPDGSKVAAAGFVKNEAHLWSVPSGSQVAALVGHTDSVSRLAFSPDGQRIISAGADGTARLWDPASGKLLGMIKMPTQYTNEISLSPDGARMVTASHDTVVRVWTLRLDGARQEAAQRSQTLQKERDVALGAGECDKVKSLDGEIGFGAQYLVCIRASRDKAVAALECDRVADLDGKSEEAPKAKLCQFQKVQKTGTARDLFQRAVDFDIDKDRARAKVLYKTLRERFPNDDLSLEAAKRLTAISDVEASEAASQRAVDAAREAASNAASAQQQTQQAIERARQDAANRRSDEYAACRRGFDSCVWSCSGSYNGTSCRDNCRSRHAMCN